MIKNVFVSVVVCAYNEEKYLEQCLEALRIQSYPSERYEIIIIDDESHDETFNIANKFKLSFLKKKHPLISLKSIPHGGLSVARNSGINVSKGDVVAFIDGDAIAKHDWVEKIANEFAKSDKPQIIGGPIHLLNKESKTASLLYHSILSFEMRPECAIIGTNMAFSKTLLDDSNVFHPLFISRGDESYLFKKLRLKHNILPRKVDSIIVEHESPESIRTWLKTRVQNGYFSVLIASLFGNEQSIYSYSKLLISLVSLVLPFLIILSLFAFQSLVLSFILFSLFVLLLIKRFIISGFLQNVIKDYYTNTKEKKTFSRISNLTYIVIIGTLGVEYGYLKGSVKYKFFKNKI
jgi:glycosyltransferase involved in cell wall biosynthesis